MNKSRTKTIIVTIIVILLAAIAVLGLLIHKSRAQIPELSDGYSPIIDSINYDVDGDWFGETCVLSYGPTSGLFTFVVTAWEDGKVEHFGCFCTQFYHLSFAEDASGTVHIQGVTQDENPETVYFDMTATNGIVQLANNGEPVSPWGPLK